MAVPAEVMFQTQLTSQDISITPSAQSKLAELIKDTEDEIAGIRIYVQGGGCSGMQYGMAFTEEAGELDAVFHGEDFKVFVDTIALSYIRGVEIDYVEKQMGASFVFNNVFASTGGSGACGACGARTGPGGGGCA